MSTVPEPAVPLSAPYSPQAAPRLTWRQTRALIRSDFARTTTMMGGAHSFGKRFFCFMLPGMQALFWYRLSRHAYLAGWRNLAALLYLFNTYWTRIEIVPATHIGAGCFIGHGPVVLGGRIGDRFTFHGDGGTGGGFEKRDIGGGPDLPVIGDDVVLAVKVLVLGPVRIGNGAHVGPGCTVTRDVPAGAVVAVPPPRVLRAAPAAGDDHAGA
jgi:serine O-acetyltransferase